MLTNIDNLVFDLGGVIVDIDRDRCVKSLLDLGLNDAANLLDLYKQEGMFLELEEGRITAADFFDYLRTKCNNKDVTDKKLEEALCDFIVGLPLNRLKALRELRKSKKIYALSNTNAIMFHSVIDELFRQEGLCIHDYFDGIVVSFVEHSCKPSRDIFNTLLQRYDLAGSRTLFLDDSQVNCDAAVACGIKSALVAPGTEFIDIINKYYE